MRKGVRFRSVILRYSLRTRNPNSYQKCTVWIRNTRVFSLEAISVLIGPETLTQMNLDLIRNSDLIQNLEWLRWWNSPFFQEYEIAHGIAGWPAAQPWLSVLSTAALSLSFHRSSLQSSGRRTAVRKNMVPYRIQLFTSLRIIRIHLFTSMRIRFHLFTSMRIRIQLFTSMRIRIQLFTSMRIRIQLFT